MNLSEALDAAMPELPAQRALKTFPRLHPKLVWREQIEGGVPVVLAHIPGNLGLYRFSPEQWDLIQLFDGNRSYQDVADAYEQQTGVAYDEADVRRFAAGLKEEGLWYRTPSEYGDEARRGHRHGAGKKSHFNVALIHFSAWDPDAFLTRIYPHLKFLYTGWFTLFTLGLFTFMGFVFIEHWGEIGRDTILYYNFTQKGVSDLAEFWILFFFLGFFHESAHGLTCKHYGGSVHRMGFQLLYLSPTFFVDITEGWVYATHWPRLAIIIAGIWTELIFCALATIVWWGTTTGSYAHELAYKVILITGVAVVVMNVNPLIKLDGYYFFCELIGVTELKEQSTAFVSGWIKRNIAGLPVTYEYVNPRRTSLYATYALLSGAYSYLLLLLVVQFAYNVMRGFNPQWAFVPALLLFFVLFKSRLRNLVNFMKTMYLDKKERIRAWLTGPRLAVLVATAAGLLFAPIWRGSVEGRFALEPEQRAVVRAEVPGEVSEVFADEGSPVDLGAPLVHLRNLELRTHAAKARAEAEVAAANATRAQLKYSSFGPAEQEKQQLAQQSRALGEEEAKLNLLSPIAGTVTTPRVRDLLGSHVKAGSTIMEIANLSEMKARIYVPEQMLRDVGVGADVAVKLDAHFESIPGKVTSIAPASTEIEPGLIHSQEYKGLRAPTYYVATVLLPNDERKLLDGLSGTAKIYRSRRSLVGLAWREVREFLERKFW